MYDDLDLDWVDLLSTDPTDYKVTDGQIDELFGKDQMNMMEQAKDFPWEYVVTHFYGNREHHEVDTKGRSVMMPVIRRALTEKSIRKTFDDEGQFEIEQAEKSANSLKEGLKVTVNRPSENIIEIETEPWPEGGWASTKGEFTRIEYFNAYTKFKDLDDFWKYVERQMKGLDQL